MTSTTSLLILPEFFRRDPDRVRRISRFLLLLLVCWITVFWRLGYLSLLDPDEAHYAEISREMRAAREWAVPLLEGAPFIDKPVLFHWIQRASFAVFGETELGARMPTALAGVIVLLTTFWAGKRLFGRDVGERAAFMLATTPASFALSSVAIFDMVFTAFLFGGFSCLAVAAVQNQPALQWLAYVLLALAVLTKGPVAVVLIALMAGIASLHPATRAVLRRIDWPVGTVMVAAFSLPWFLWMWVTFGQRFFDDYFLYNNLWLFGAPLYRQRFSALFYGRVFLTTFLPWSPIVVGRLADLLRDRQRITRLESREVILWSWLIAVIGFFSLSRFKLDHYIFPAAPAACLLAALGWQHLVESQDKRAVLFTRLSVVAIAGVFLAAGILTATYMFAIDLPLPATAVVLPVTLCVGGLVVGGQLLIRKMTPPRFPLPIIATMVCVYAIVVAIGFPVLERTRPTRNISHWIVSHTQSTDRLATYRLERWEASLRFYSHRPVLRAHDPDAVRKLLADPGRTYLVVLEPQYQELLKAGVQLQTVYTRVAVIGNSGRGFRRQRWGPVMVVTAK